MMTCVLAAGVLAALVLPLLCGASCVGTGSGGL